MVVVVLFSPVEIILGFLVDACDFARSKYSSDGQIKDAGYDDYCWGSAGAPESSSHPVWGGPTGVRG